MTSLSDAKLITNEFDIFVSISSGAVTSINIMDKEVLLIDGKVFLVVGTSWNETLTFANKFGLPIADHQDIKFGTLDTTYRKGRICRPIEYTVDFKNEHLMVQKD